MQLLAGQRYRHMNTGDICIVESIDMYQKKVKARYEKSGLKTTIPLNVMYEFFEQL